MQKYLLDRVDSLFHPDCRFNIEHLEKTSLETECLPQ